MSQQNNTNAKTQDASADVVLFSELQCGVSEAKWILYFITCQQRAEPGLGWDKFLRCLHRYQKGQMMVCYKVAVRKGSKRSGTAELILRLQEIEDEGFFCYEILVNQI